MIALLLLLLAAAPAATDAPAARQAISRVAVATVTIVAAEPVEISPPAPAERKLDRQYRRRDAVPLVEFF